MRDRTMIWLRRLWVLALVVGIVGMVQKFTAGERTAGYGSYVPWGLWVAIYFHAVGIAGGVFLAGVLGHLAGLEAFRRHLRLTLWVSGSALVTGFLAIWLDLGQPWRAYLILLSPNFTSMLAFNSWMYGVFLASLAVAYVLAGRRAHAGAVNDRSGWLAPVLMFGLTMALAFPSQSGAFLGVLGARTFWNNPLLPILFLAGAVTSGAATLFLVHTFLAAPGRLDDAHFRYLRRVTLWGMGIYFALEFSEFSIGFWAPGGEARASLELILFGPFWWVFWLVHLGGAAVAAWLLLRGRSLAAVGTGAFLVALTFVSSRLNILIPGQLVSELHGLREAFWHPRLSSHYVATLNEYLVAIFIGVVGTALVYAGLRAASTGSGRKEASTR